MSHESDSNQDGKARTVLLIDDDEDVLFSCRLFLIEKGYVVEPFKSAKAALETLGKADRSYYDIIIIDLCMPEINGLQLYNSIKSFNKHAKVLFLTALDSSNELFALFPEVELKHLIRKPIDRESFVKAIELELEKE